MGREAVILCTVAAAGIGVAYIGSKADPKYHDPVVVMASNTDQGDNDQSDEFKALCTSWFQNKHHLAGIFKILGHMFVAPIVYTHMNRINTSYGNPLRLPQD